MLVDFIFSTFGSIQISKVLSSKIYLRKKSLVFFLVYRTQLCFFSLFFIFSIMCLYFFLTISQITGTIK